MRVSGIQGGELDAPAIALDFTASWSLLLIFIRSARLSPIRRRPGFEQRRSFALALRWQRRAVTRRTADRLYRDHARSAGPSLRPTLDHGCCHAEIRPRGRRKRFRWRPAVVTGRQMVRVSGASG